MKGIANIVEVDIQGACFEGAKYTYKDEANKETEFLGHENIREHILTEARRVAKVNKYKINETGGSLKTARLRSNLR